MRRSGLLLGSMLLAAGPALSACGPSAVYVLCVGMQPDGVTAADLVGAYAGKPHGRLTPAADGTMTVSDRSHRRSLFTGPDRVARAEGSWVLRENRSDEGVMEVVLTFEEEGRKEQETAGITGSRKRPTLSYDVGTDPDDCDVVTLSRAG